MALTAIDSGDASPAKISSLDVEKRESESPDPALTPFKRPISEWKWILVCVGLYLGALLYGLDTTIAADVQGPILNTLGEIEKLAWVGIGFPMGSVAVILLVGWCYGLFEIKYLMIASIVTFEAGSAICGAAPSMNALIVGRVVAGIGGAGMYLGALTYISIFTSLKERPIYNALIGLCWGTGCILGPVVGGGFAVSNATYRWAFYLNLPLAAILSPVYIWLFPKYNAKPDEGGLTKMARIDWLGAALNAAVFSLFMIVLNFAGSIWTWNSAGPIALWVVFGITLIAYAVQQAFSILTTPERRLFPVQFLKSRTMLLLYFGTATASTGLCIGVYFIPIFFQFTKGDSAIQAAVRLLPFIALTVSFVMISGGLLPVLGRYQPFYFGTGILLIIGGSLMHTVDAETATSTIYGYEIIIAIGAGLTMQVAYSVVAVKVQPHEIQGAIGFINVAQIGSIAISLSIGASIFQNVGFAKLQTALAAYNFTDAEIRSALGGAQSAILATSDNAIRKLATDAIVATISNAWFLTITAGAVSLVSAIFMRPEKLKLEGIAG